MGMSGGEDTLPGGADGSKEGLMLVEVVDAGGRPWKGGSTVGCDIWGGYGWG